MLLLILTLVVPGAEAARPAKTAAKPPARAWRADAAPWVIAHRGASSTHPENTMAAFRQALLDGADALEMDAQTTKDGRLVLLHDDTLDRTSDGSGPVSKLTYEQVRQLDAGSWKHRRFAGERIPLLSEVAALAREAGVGLVVEAKTPYPLEPDLAVRIADELDKAGVLDRSIIQAFDHRPLAELHRQRPRVRLGPLIDAGIDAVEPVVRACGAWAYLPSYEYVFPDRVDKLHDLGVLICPWTVDRPEHMQLMVRAGVDGIMTNKPALLRGLLDRMKLPRKAWPMR